MHSFVVLVLITLLSGCRSVSEGERKKVSNMVARKTEASAPVERADLRDTTDIPAAVRRAAQEHLRDDYFVRYCGETQRRTEVYTLAHRSELTAPLPTVYLWDGRQVNEVRGTGALRILNATHPEERRTRSTDSDAIALKSEKEIPYEVLAEAYVGWLVQYVGRTADGAAVYRAFPDGEKDKLPPMVLVWENGLLQEYWGERAVRGVLDEVVDCKEIPAAVLAEYDRHKGSLNWPLEYFGQGADGAEVYILNTPIEYDVGLPILYLWNKGQVTRIYGMESLDYLQTVKPRD